MITKDSPEYGVHNTHCCYTHGCAYWEDAVCPVVNGLGQGIVCQDCVYDDIEMEAAITLLISRGFIPEGFDYKTHTLENVPKERI